MPGRLTLGRCACHPHKYTSRELLFDGFLPGYPKDSGVAPIASGALLVPKEPWYFHRCLLSSETHIRPVGALALRLITCGLNDCLFLFYFSPNRMS